MKIKNNEELAVGDMIGELLERRALPIGRTQFEEWADRIIDAAQVEASDRSLKHSLCHMLMHLGPTEAFREDAYFVLQLRNAAVKQTAHMLGQEIKEAFEQEKKAKETKAEDTAPSLGVVNGGDLAN